MLCEKRAPRWFSRRVRYSAGFWGAFTATTRSMPGPGPTKYKDPPTRLVGFGKNRGFVTFLLLYFASSITSTPIKLTKTIVTNRLIFLLHPTLASLKSERALVFSHVHETQPPLPDQLVVSVRCICSKCVPSRHGPSNEFPFYNSLYRAAKVILRTAYSPRGVDTGSGWRCERFCMYSRC